MIEFDYDFHHDPLAIAWEVYRDASGGRIEIDACRQEDGSTLYAIRDRKGFCLSKSATWDYESFPSSRPDDWLETHRFPTLKAAWDKACVAGQTMVLDYKERVDAWRVSQGMKKLYE